MPSRRPDGPILAWYPYQLEFGFADSEPGRASNGVTVIPAVDLTGFFVVERAFAEGEHRGHDVRSSAHLRRTDLGAGLGQQLQRTQVIAPALRRHQPSVVATASNLHPFDAGSR
ncbi:hypothetical protein [Nocardia caishijiensis]|uniref:hypothetical protein n=1 Tax=Nocardia caishijiensis TaxID=184756 RepID=UPI0008351F1D|nr:hypothetical protein [Nocardia caishijiensis]